MSDILAKENAELRAIIENLATVFPKVENFYIYLKLLNLINERDLTVKKKKDTKLSRQYIDITYEDLSQLIEELVEGAGKQKEFESFLKMFDLIEFKRKNTSTQSTIMLTIGDRQVKGCSIVVDKYNYAISLLNEVDA